MDNIYLFHDFTCIVDEIEKLESFLDASQRGLLVSAQIMSDNLEVEISSISAPFDSLDNSREYYHISRTRLNFLSDHRYVVSYNLNKLFED